MAVLGDDFTEPSLLQVTFSSGDVVGDTACAAFGILNDDNLEFDHEFTVNIESVTPPGLVNSSATTVNIVDDDGMHCIVFLLNLTNSHNNFDICLIFKHYS